MGGLGHGRVPRLKCALAACEGCIVWLFRATGGWVVAGGRNSIWSKTAIILATLSAIAGASPSSAQLNAEAQRAYQAYQLLAPHRAFAVAPDGKADSWSDASGADPSSAVDSVLKRCQERAKTPCTLYAVNNVVLNGRDWKAAAPPVLPNIGRLRPEPYWDNKGPGSAAGLIVWSHGYMLGRDATQSAPQGEAAYFTAKGYDLYRFANIFAIGPAMPPNSLMPSGRPRRWVIAG